MNRWEFYVALVFITGVVGPLFWLVSLSVLLWLGRKFLPHKVGRVLFGHLWDNRQVS